MPKFNPYSLPRPAASVETRQFVDPFQPDVPFILSFRVPKGTPFRARVQQKSSELQQKFTGPKPHPLPAHQNEPVVVGQYECDTVALIICCQVEQEGSDTFNLIEAFGLSSSHPVAFGKVYEWGMGLLNAASPEDEKAEEDENEEPDFTGTTSAPASTTTKPTRK